MLDSLSTAVLLLDGQLCVDYANHAAEQLLATSLAHLHAQPLDAFFDGADWSAAALRHALDLQQAYTQREARLHRLGSTLPVTVDYVVTPVPPGREHAPQLLIELLPLDRLLHINREDNLFTANQATRALVRGLAHEIKNPLGGIRGAAQLLERELARAELREYTQVIIGEADRLRALADRMLDARRPPSFREVNIHEVLERVRVILQAEVGDALRWVRDYDPSLPEVWADADQMIQVMLNIMRNAAQALLEMPRPGGSTAAGEPPCITLRSRVLRQSAIGTRRYPLLCLIEVQDNGPGIAEELREMLFYPMVTGRSQGTGLGLPIAQAIMQQHGGLIECESRPGKTVFKVLIPFRRVADGNTGAPIHAHP
ncbi:PAS domain-containing sensor histidine kinase [Comamonas flocculans]|uniref:Sensory histidine kinase/phosphatase NtrB n=1 Tax=Comamonas flocculans TaxID=2597701 RepID=A0A5B8RY51_9BURK|nr:PAS domain-containing sensor histidine kinase [Comamonas flocculans]